MKTLKLGFPVIERNIETLKLTGQLTSKFYSSKKMIIFYILHNNNVYKSILENKIAI